MKLLKGSLLETVKTLKKIHNSRQNEAHFKNLFNEESSRCRINMIISLCKLPKIPNDGKVQPVTISGPLPHCFVDDSTDVLLITKSIRGFGKDVDRTIHKYQDLLRSHNALELITEVMPLGKLKHQYSDYEAKRALSSQFDIVLCEASVFSRIPKLLGKPFYSKKKFPIQVNLKAGNLRGEILKVLSKAYLRLSLEGSSAMVQIARFDQTNEEIAANVKEFTKTLGEKLPGGWANVRSIHLKTDISTSLPLYINTTSPAELPEVKHPQEREDLPLAEEGVTTAGDKTVSVFASGDVRLIPRRVPAEDVKEFLESQKEEQLRLYDRYDPEGNKVIKGTKQKARNTWQSIKIPKVT